MSVAICADFSVDLFGLCRRRCRSHIACSLIQFCCFSFFFACLFSVLEVCGIWHVREQRSGECQENVYNAFAICTS